MDINNKTESLSFGAWNIESLIGKGSFGRVYRIYRDEMGNRFYSALKHISIPEDKEDVEQLRMDGMDDESISTFYTELVMSIESEMSLMSRLRGNSNIVSFEDSMIISKPDGMGYDIYIRMELLNRLTERIKGSALTKDEALRLGMDICNALTVCSKYGIIHRDVKPENIFISDIGDYKLGDFGIARQLEKTATFMSKKGTPNYMAPEVYKGEKYGVTCDLYSLGLVMYRQLNKGRLPFLPPAPEGITLAEREAAFMKRMMGETMPNPCDADEELSRIILKACAYKPEDRYSSSEEMKEALLVYRAGIGNKEETVPEITAGGAYDAPKEKRDSDGNPDSEQEENSRETDLDEEEFECDSTVSAIDEKEDGVGFYSEKDPAEDKHGNGLTVPVREKKTEARVQDSGSRGKVLSEPRIMPAARNSGPAAYNKTTKGKRKKGYKLSFPQQQAKNAGLDAFELLNDLKANWSKPF